MTQQPESDSIQERRGRPMSLKYWQKKAWDFLNLIFFIICVVFLGIFACWVLSLLFNDGKEISGIRQQVLLGVGAISIPLLGSILLKEGKISEFRQNWIDGLRESIAEFYANAKALGCIDVKEAFPKQVTKKSLALQAEISKILMGLDKQMWLIELRLNPHDRVYKKLQKALKEFQDSNEKYATANADKYLALVKDLRKVEPNLLELSQEILKNEWKRVKRGEQTFCITKLILWGMLCGSLFFLFIPYQPVFFWMTYLLHKYIYMLQ